MPEGRVLDSPPIESGTSELTISEARRALLDLPEKLARTPERAVTITRRGQPVLAMLPREFYERIIETLDIPRDSEMVKALREGLEGLERGRVVTTRRPRTASAYERGSRLRDTWTETALKLVEAIPEQRIRRFIS
jgi:PHD/YefM family antitoxin component YafN of YafNO toxin-antitoxin module